MNFTYKQIIFGALALAIVAFASSAGTIVAGKFFGPALESPQPIILNADSSVRGEQLSMATGYVDRRKGIDGLFVLDHLSGNLQCSILNPRTGDIAAIYSANVNEDLQLNKAGDADFVMTTGNFQVEGRRGNQRPADCVCYVADGNSGRMVLYGIAYDTQLAVKEGVQRGGLQVVGKGLTREEGMKRDN